MNENQLFDKLAWMKREVKALKVAHERGLGVVDFFRKRITVASYSEYKPTIFTITAIDGLTPFFLQILTSRRTAIDLKSTIVSDSVIKVELVFPFFEDSTDIVFDFITSAKVNVEVARG